MYDIVKLNSMFDNVPERFVPDNVPEYVFAHPSLHYWHNTDELNATYEILERGIVKEGWGNNTAICVHATDETITYEELLSRVERFAGALRDIGVRPGDRVFWRLHGIPEAYLVQLAIWKIGAVNVPSSPAESAREVEFFINDTEAVVAITQEEAADAVADAIENMPSIEEVVVFGDAEVADHSLDELLKTADPYEEYADTKPSDLASIFYTGGTTGQPKGCMHTHAGEITGGDLEGKEGRGLTPADVMFSIQPIGHAAGNTDKINIPLRNGAQVILAVRPDIPKILEVIEERAVTTLTTVGTILRQMFKEVELTDYDFSSVEFHLNMIMDDELLKRWEEATGIEACNGLGMTPMRHYFITGYRNGEKISPGVSIGKPYAGYETKVVEIDDPETEVSGDDIGRLAIRGPTVTAYWNNIHPEMPEKMALDSVDGWALHDDVILRDEDGSYYLRGRIDGMINSSGFTIAPAEVEEVVSQHPAVNDVAVVGKPDEMREEIVYAFVVPEVDTETNHALKADIQEFAKENIAKYKYPREIKFLDLLPRDDVGKVQYGNLQEEVR